MRINPSDTGNIRLSSLFRLTDELSLTFDPSVQYTLANGGGYTALSEQDAKLRGNVPGPCDLLRRAGRPKIARMAAPRKRPLASSG